MSSSLLLSSIVTSFIVPDKNVIKIPFIFSIIAAIITSIAVKELARFIFSQYKLSAGEIMNETLLKEIYSEIKKVREKLEMLEELIIPTEKVSEEELLEIKKLKEESLKGEHIDWDEFHTFLDFDSVTEI
jgi:hypothetical protein